MGQTKATSLGQIRVTESAIPASIRNTTAESYSAFLKERRLLMAQIIKSYYFAL